ncbi:hypothetical protein BYT27DRAFT_7213438 [Phlegmacium glaucopus]|nr:hypothetical protein BYT27DRAFT_7213438 [Phlegmacium glaucopus]
MFGRLGKAACDAIGNNRLFDDREGVYRMTYSCDGGRSMWKIRTSLRKGLLALRAFCLRSFPEFLSDLKLEAMARGSNTGIKLIDFTVSNIKYIEKIPRVQTAAESTLHALGD